LPVRSPLPNRQPSTRSAPASSASSAASSDYNYATAFQFTPMAGVGVQIGSHQQYQVGYRFQHISNGGIKEPNPGINFHQLYLQYNF